MLPSCSSILYLQVLWLSVIIKHGEKQASKIKSNYSRDEPHVSLWQWAWPGSSQHTSRLTTTLIEMAGLQTTYTPIGAQLNKPHIHWAGGYRQSPVLFRKLSVSFIFSTTILDHSQNTATGFSRWMDICSYVWNSIKFGLCLSLVREKLGTND